MLSNRTTMGTGKGYVLLAVAAMLIGTASAGGKIVGEGCMRKKGLVRRD